MPNTSSAYQAGPEGPWWVQDQETGHKFATFSPGEHLTVLSESPYTTAGTLRAAEPAEHVGPVSKKGASS
jgi:hypothetical protein